MKHKSGFTLAELSIVLIIIALVIGMTVSSGVTTISAARYSATNSKMAALDQALMAFRIANNRIPCPADLSQVQGSATYGTEGSCTAVAGGVFVAANSGGTATAAEGGVPTAALGLPNDFMYDGWGNRFRYAVDTRMATTGAFSLMQIGCVNGAITVYAGPNYPATGNAARTTGAVYALISHGANGHGGVTKNAVVTNAGALNSDELTNCHCTSTGAAGTYAPTYVQLAPYTYQAIGQANSHYNFDDIVSYKTRWQMQTNWDKVGTNCAGGAFSRAITINSSYVSTVNHTNLTNFPMLFSGTYSYLATTANGGAVTNANGYDITFTSDAAGLNLLPFERESWSATTGAVTFWVQVPTVSGSANTTIYLWYDDPDIVTDQSNKTGTWDSNYVGVWHMGDNAANTTVKESTSNNNTGYASANTSTKTTTGQINGGLSFNGTNDTVYTGNSTAYNTATGTWETWFYPMSNSVSTWGEGILVYNDLGGSSNNLVTINYNWNSGNSTNYIEARDRQGSEAWPYRWFVDSATTLSLNTWYHIVLVQNGVSAKLYINGSLDATATQGNGLTVWTSALGQYYFSIDESSGSNFTPAKIDEVRVSNTARSADWIKTEYNNQNSPGTFYTVGSAVTTR